MEILKSNKEVLMELKIKFEKVYCNRIKGIIVCINMDSLYKGFSIY